MKHGAPPLLALLATAAPLAAQSNAVPGMDVELGGLGTGLGVLQQFGQPELWGRIGDYPEGTIGVTFATTACNVGTVDVAWEQAKGTPMGDDHPYIASLVARESAGRMVQISDYSSVKHAYVALTDEQCGGTCNQLFPGGGGDVLGQGCSDTYDVFTNGYRYWLAPASEIDPWEGHWSPFRTHFDRGDPDVGFPENSDGERSLTEFQVANLDVLAHRVQVRDEELDVPDSDFYYQGYYVVRGEPEANRENNLRSRDLHVAFDGEWVLTDGDEESPGTVLSRWSGASISSNTNGDDDGRVYLAARVTGPVNGLYHYEYAVHNRDADRGVGELRIPLCPQSSLSGVGFRDIDTDAGNDWDIARAPSALVFSTALNPVRWNSIYNFWFDSDAAPEPGALEYAPHDPGPGASSVSIPCDLVPTGQYQFQVGAGCSFGTPPAVHADGAPAKAELGNATYAAVVTGNDPGALVLPLAGLVQGALQLGLDCELMMVGGIQLLPLVTADLDGVATVPLPIPSTPVFEGLAFTFQAASLRAAGPLSGVWDLSGAMRVRVGNGTAGCPGE